MRKDRLPAAGRETPVADTSDDSAEHRPLVQSLTRAFELLELMADAGGEAGLSELADATGIPLPTIHRLMRTLVHGGYARQGPSRRYALGPSLVRLGESASRLLGLWARPYLAQLVDLTGETANLALREGDEAVYVAQVPSKHSMRMFTEVGRRVPLHSSAVGKAILAQLPPADVQAIISRAGLSPQTEMTITDADALRRQVELVRRLGYATDLGEYEVGVSCVAVPLVGAVASAAVSVSGPAARLTAETRERIAPFMQQVSTELSAALEHRVADERPGP